MFSSALQGNKSKRRTKKLRDDRMNSLFMEDHGLANDAGVLGNKRLETINIDLPKNLFDVLDRSYNEDDKDEDDKDDVIKCELCQLTVCGRAVKESERENLMRQHVSSKKHRDEMRKRAMDERDEDGLRCLLCDVEYAKKSHGKEEILERYKKHVIGIGHKRQLALERAPDYLKPETEYSRPNRFEKGALKTPWRKIEEDRASPKDDESLFRLAREYVTVKRCCDDCKKDFREAIRYNNEDTLNKIVQKMYLNESFGGYSYTENLSVQLYLEKETQDVNIRSYDKINQRFTRVSHNLFSFDVEGLSEKRPSILCGDKVGASDARFEHFGVIERIEMNRVIVRFSRAFNTQNSYKVRFILNHLQLELQQAAINFDVLGDDYSAEYESYVKPPLLGEENPSMRFKDIKSIEDLSWKNSKLDESQKSAVKNALYRVNLSTPYVIFGPPGTGKTTTMIEVIAQLIKRNERVLILAPSNDAVDNILERVLQTKIVTNAEALRVYGFNRSRSQVSAAMLESSTYEVNQEGFKLPSTHRFETAKIVAMTLMSAARTVRLMTKINKIPYVTNFFNNVIIDEAGHAMESELLAGFVGFLNPDKNKSRLILAGDHRQLGPIVNCEHNKDLPISMLERLCHPTDDELPKTVFSEKIVVTPYSRTIEFDKEYVSMLTKNYRSHPGIIELSSKMFYGSKLEACLGDDHPVTTLFKNWKELPSHGRNFFPVVFDSVTGGANGTIGGQMRESNSPSWFNPDEILCVENWIAKILRDFQGKISEEDIGIVTPYHKQKQKLNKMLEKRRWKGIVAGSTESFQGQERKVIIITTVRSSFQDEKEKEIEVRRDLGFLTNPKRFNVAITRAQSLLVVCGNPFTLRGCENWRELMKLCKTRGTFLEGHMKCDINDYTIKAPPLPRSKKPPSATGKQPAPKPIRPPAGQKNKQNGFVSKIIPQLVIPSTTANISEAAANSGIHRCDLCDIVYAKGNLSEKLVQDSLLRHTEGKMHQKKMHLLRFGIPSTTANSSEAAANSEIHKCDLCDVVYAKGNLSEKLVQDSYLRHSKGKMHRQKKYLLRFGIPSTTANSSEAAAFSEIHKCDLCDVVYASGLATEKLVRNNLLRHTKSKMHQEMLLLFNELQQQQQQQQKGNHSPQDLRTTISRVNGNVVAPKPSNTGAQKQQQRDIRSSSSQQQQQQQQQQQDLRTIISHANETIVQTRTQLDILRERTLLKKELEKRRANKPPAPPPTQTNKPPSPAQDPAKKNPRSL